MSRMHSGAKGKSSSTKPEVKETPQWNTAKAKDIEAVIVDLAKQGKTAAQIGLVLRDQHGVVCCKTVTGKRITEIMVAKKVGPEIPEDLRNLIKRSVQIRKHLEANHKDQTAKRGLTLTESKIRRLVKYYKAQDILPLDWKFDAESVKMYAQ